MGSYVLDTSMGGTRLAVRLSEKGYCFVTVSVG